MSTITMTTATPVSGSFGKVFAWLGKAWTARRARAALAGMSEREFQDIGWGQSDRHSHALRLEETPPERRARAAAVAAWHAPQKKAA
ncbi:MAG: DUF1127 domain-containing protein [Pseudomonadota bacterium]|nr:DUF1127 domain-containing protein [Pseudomonadota bacterium]